MARPSSISKLPKKVREKIATLRNQGQTIDNIMAHLDTLDVDVSRSSLGRHLKKQSEVADKIRKSREMAEAVGRQFGDKETSKVARTNIELLHSIMMTILIGEDDENGDDIKITAKEAMMLASSLQKLSQASKLDVDRELKIREEERRKAKIDATKAVDKEAKRQGLTKETVEAIKSKILGV